MLTSTIVALVAFAASTPTLAAPTYMRRGDSDDSGALLNGCPVIARGVKAARCATEHIVPPDLGLPPIVYGSQQNKRDESGALRARFCPLVARAGISLSGCPTEPLLTHINLPDLLKRDEDQSSGAFGLEDAAHVASIGSSLVSIGEDIFGSKKNGRDESGALALPKVGIPVLRLCGRSGCGVPSSVPTALRLGSRENQAYSGAFSLEDAANVASIGSSLVNIGEDIFGKKKTSRELEVARDDSSGAISLGTIGTIVSVAAPVIGGIIDHFTSKQQRDSFMEGLVARSILDELD